MKIIHTISNDIAGIDVPIEFDLETENPNFIGFKIDDVEYTIDTDFLRDLAKILPELKNENIKQMEINESVVVGSAVKYMLGRSSYGVESVCDFLKDNLNRLTPSNKEVIIRDIREYFEKNPDASYKKDWFEVVELLTKRLLNK